MDKALAMQHTAGLSYGFWEFAVESAVHIYNRTPTRVLKWRTPYAVWNNGTIPDIHICVYLAAKPTCMYLLTSVANWMKNPL